MKYIFYVIKCFFIVLGVFVSIEYGSRWVYEVLVLGWSLVVLNRENYIWIVLVMWKFFL